MARTEIRDTFNRNRTAGEIDRGLVALAARGLAVHEKETTGGRPAERWKWAR